MMRAKQYNELAPYTYACDDCVHSILTDKLYCMLKNEQVLKELLDEECKSFEVYRWRY